MIHFKKLRGSLKKKALRSSSIKEEFISIISLIQFYSNLILINFIVVTGNTLIK